ncbi:hypothetical protein EPN87_03700 [archaeon]|nr:MAG: hypothetical protein EPN87_03700 [archaeon]
MEEESPIIPPVLARRSFMGLLALTGAALLVEGFIPRKEKKEQQVSYKYIEYARIVESTRIKDIAVNNERFTIRGYIFDTYPGPFSLIGVEYPIAKRGGTYSIWYVEDPEPTDKKLLQGRVAYPRNWVPSASEKYHALGYLIGLDNPIHPLPGTGQKPKVLPMEYVQ